MPQDRLSAAIAIYATVCCLQLVDDMLDFTGNLQSLGKPALNDLKSGLATAPVLYAAQEHPQLRPLILRKFAEPGDVQLAQQLVKDSQGIAKTKEFAAQQAQQAADVVRCSFHYILAISLLSCHSDHTNSEQYSPINPALQSCWRTRATLMILHSGAACVKLFAHV